MNRIVRYSCALLLLLTGSVGTGKALEPLDDEQIYEIAKSEVIARHPDLASRLLQERNIVRRSVQSTKGEPLPGFIVAAFGVSGSQRPLKLDMEFLTRTTWEVVMVKMSEKGKVSSVSRVTRSKIIPDIEQESVRLEASKKAGYKGLLSTLLKPKFIDAPLFVVLDHYTQVSGITVVRDPSAPHVRIFAEAEGYLTEKEFLELMEILLEEKGVLLERRVDGTIRAYSQWPGP